MKAISESSQGLGVITDYETVFFGLRALLTPTAIAKTFAPGPRRYRRFLSDLAHLTELLSCFDYVFLTPSTYEAVGDLIKHKKLVPDLEGGKTLLGVPDPWIMYPDLCAADAEDMYEAYEFLWAELFETEVIRPWPEEVEDRQRATSILHPGIKTGKRAAGDSYQALESCCCFAAATSGSIPHYRPSPIGQSYLACIAPTAYGVVLKTTVESIISNLSRGMEKELAQLRSVFPVETQITVPFAFQLALGLAGRANRLPHAILDVRSLFQKLRDTVTELEMITSDEFAPLSHRMRARRRLERLLEESSRDFNAASKWCLVPWRDVITDVWSLVDDSANSLTSADLKVKGIGSFLLKQPLDLLLHVLRNRRLCHLPSVRARALRSPAFEQLLAKTYASPMSRDGWIDLQEYASYEPRPHFVLEMLQYGEFPSEWRDSLLALLPQKVRQKTSMANAN